MLAAIETVKGGTVSINKAALLHSVPRTTLKDRLSGREVHGTNQGPRPYHTTTEETALRDHLVEAAKAGYGKTRTQVNRKRSERKRNFTGTSHIRWLVA